MTSRIDLTGKTFGRWTVLSFAKSSHAGAHWNAVCSCGTERVLVGTCLHNGKTMSCGCASAEALGNRSRKHGRALTYLYETWRGILRRCLNPKSDAYRNYGARGISVIKEWVDDFETFERDIINSIGHRPTEDHSIDRIDNDRGYEPGNLRWASQLEQVHNSRMFKTGMQRWTRARLIEEVQRLRKELEAARSSTPNEDAA